MRAAPSLLGAKILMSRLSSDAWLGLGVIAVGVFLLLVLIPVGVTSPSNVRIAVLSPTMWPKIVSGAIILLGAILLIRSLIAGHENSASAEESANDGLQSWIRIGVIAALMIAFFFSIPFLGMPLASIIVILAYALLVKSRRPIIMSLTAIVLPLMIYGFFNHVASVPIPQGKILRLP